MKKGVLLSSVKAFVTFSVLILIHFTALAVEPEFYTIQTGSFITIENAEKQFTSISQGVSEEDPGFLRIEKIGKYYTVRLGKFKDYAAAEKFLRTNGPGLNTTGSPVILKASFTEERIIRLYSKGKSVKDTGNAVTQYEPEDIQMTQQPLPVNEAEVPAEEESEGGKDVEGVLEDNQLTQSPLPVDEAAVPAEAASVGEKDVEGAIEDYQSAQAPLPANEAEVPVQEEVPVIEKKTEAKLKDAQVSQKKPLSAGEDGILSKIKGRFYISDYYSNDSDDFEFHVLTSRLNVYKREEDESVYYFALDARVRKKIFSGDIKEEVPRYKVDEAWVGFKFPKPMLNIVGGRQYIYELYNTRIDGLNLKYSFKKGLGMGIFGGLAPDKEDESLNTDFKSIGGYVFLNQERHKVYFGYENLSYKGDTDREYFSLRIYSKFHEKFRFNGVSSASINQLTEDFEVESANANLLYTHSKKLRFNIFYNYYRTIKFYASTREYLLLPDIEESFFLDDNSRTRAGLRIDYKLMRGLKIYTSGAYERRKEDDKDKLRLTGGIRKYDLYGFDISGRYTYIDDFESESDEFHAEISRNFFNKVDLSLYASREEKKLDVENAFTERTLVYGSSLYWMITRRYFFTAFIERSKDEDYVNTSVFTQLGYKF